VALVFVVIDAPVLDEHLGFELLEPLASLAFMPPSRATQRCQVDSAA
jgi:hypothetical protein